jgi:hypothetical protein
MLTDHQLAVKYNVTATPSSLPKWFEPYTYWRFVGLPREFPGSLAKFPRPPFPKHITSEVQWVLDEWDRFALWSAWIDGGRRGVRPAGLWISPRTGKPVSPSWAVRTRRLVVSHRPHPVPPVVFPPPPTPVPPHLNLNLGRRKIYMAQEAQKALMYPSYMGFYFTADRGYQRPSSELIQQLKNQGSFVGAWCDCHSTFPDEAKHMVDSLGLDGWSGEGESAGAFQVALDAGAPMAAINISALTGAQKDAIRDGLIVVTNELYLNQDASRAARENWENLPVASRLDACYDAQGEADTGRRFAMSEYIQIGKWVPRQDCFYDPGATDWDRKLVS